VEENQAAAALRRCLFKGMSTRGKEAVRLARSWIYDVQEDQPAAALSLCVIRTKNQVAAGLRCGGVMVDVMLHAREHTHTTA